MSSGSRAHLFYPLIFIISILHFGFVVYYWIKSFSIKINVDWGLTPFITTISCPKLKQNSRNGRLIFYCTHTHKINHILSHFITLAFSHKITNLQQHKRSDLRSHFKGPLISRSMYHRKIRHSLIKPYTITEFTIQCLFHFIFCASSKNKPINSIVSFGRWFCSKIKSETINFWSFRSRQSLFLTPDRQTRNFAWSSSNSGKKLHVFLSQNSSNNNSQKSHTQNDEFVKFRHTFFFQHISFLSPTFLSSQTS